MTRTGSITKVRCLQTEKKPPCDGSLPITGEVAPRSVFFDRMNRIYRMKSSGSQIQGLTGLS
jgi:hypothetical protein